MRAPFLIDSHCHLDAAQFAEEPVASLLARAAAAGVERMVSIGTDLATSRAAVDLADAHAPVYATVGVDPNSAAGYDAAARAELRALAAHPKVLAIGEIGLDYHWMVSPSEHQAAVFIDQLALAATLGLPVVIHCRDAHEDAERILGAWAAERHRAGWPTERPVGVMHCYSGDLAEALRLHAAGWMISLAGPVTYKNAARNREVAAGLPLEALVLETDAPYLAPAPRRGERNEPAFVRHTAEFVAGLRGLDLAELAAATTANAVRLFAGGLADGLAATSMTTAAPAARELA